MEKNLKKTPVYIYVYVCVCVCVYIYIYIYIYIYVCMNQFAVHLKLTQLCKSAILQFLKNIKQCMKKEKFLTNEEEAKNRMLWKTWEYVISPEQQA